MSLTHPSKGAIACSPNGQILMVKLPDKEAIAMLHSGSANTGFNLVTQVPIPNTGPVHYLFFLPPPVFSADGLKFAIVAKDGTVSVWDVRNKRPFMVKEPDGIVDTVSCLQFSGGTLGREVLAFVEVSQLCLGIIFFMLIKLLEQRCY